MKIILLIITVTINNILCANILYISPLPSPSHQIWNKALSIGLIEKGHNITMLSTGIEKGNAPNFTVITTEGLHKALQQSYKIRGTIKTNTLWTVKGLYDLAKFVCNYDMNTTGLETLLKYPSDFKFDLIIYEITIIQCLYPLIERFNNPPVVGVTPFLLPPILSHAFGNNLPLSYNPFYSSEVTRKMNTVDRVLNLIYTYLEIFIRDYIYSSVEYAIAKKRFGDNICPFGEVEQNINILFANTDPVVNYPISLPANIIPVGGMHTRPAGDLPEDLRKIMDNAEHGVILFSLGSNVRSADLALEQRQILLDVFEKLPHIILWKFEADDIGAFPKNIITRKWWPQNDILSHPNTKLFISHGGALSTHEAMYHGVPVLGIPFYGDQFVNIRQMKEKGIAEYLDFSQKVTTDEVYGKINSVLNSNKFRNNMKTISKLYRDQPQTALETAVFWIEYVLRHGNTKYLGLASRDMPSYQAANLDVLATVFVLVLVLIILLYMLILAGCHHLLAMRC